MKEEVLTERGLKEEVLTERGGEGRGADREKG